MQVNTCLLWLRGWDRRHLIVTVRPISSSALGIEWKAGRNDLPGRSCSGYALTELHIQCSFRSIHSVNFRRGVSRNGEYVDADTETAAAKRIVGLAGSLRAASFNRQLLAAVAFELPPGVTLEVWDGLQDVPPFNEDIEGGPAPVAVTELRSVIGDADGVLIATPEYNGSIPGQLKNALDWASRPRGDAVLEGKPVATLSASPSRRGVRGRRRTCVRFLVSSAPRSAATKLRCRASTNSLT
jgi:chromate reductase